MHLLNCRARRGKVFEVEISREDAGRALQEIGQTADRVFSRKYYRSAAPFFIIWGLVWMVANFSTAWIPAYANLVWLVTVAIGTAASVLTGYLAPDTRSANDEVARASRRRRLRFLLSFIAIIAFQVLSSMIMPPWQSGLQVNAYISLLWALVYILAGVWGAARVAWLGVLLAATVLFGFFVIPGYFSLWMGMIGGGLLIGSGLWLMKA